MLHQKNTTFQSLMYWRLCCTEHAEADTFFCFTNLMSENRDNFIKSLDDSQCGITYKMESVYAMLKDKDPELYLKLVRSKLSSSAPFLQKRKINLKMILCMCMSAGC